MTKRRKTTPVEVDHQTFLDETAIALFARGWPLSTVWTQAERLWASRSAHLEAQPTGTSAISADSSDKASADVAEGGK